MRDRRAPAIVRHGVNRSFTINTLFTINVSFTIPYEWSASSARMR